MKYLLSSTAVGLVSGIFLFIVCALIERFTHLEFMTLLLNVDFIINRDIHIGVEILLHLIISIMIAGLLKIIFDKFPSLYIPSLIFSWVITSMLFYVLDYLSVMYIELHGLSGFIVWTIIHLFYFTIIFIIHKKGY